MYIYVYGVYRLISIKEFRNSSVLVGSFAESLQELFTKSYLWPFQDFLLAIHLNNIKLNEVRNLSSLFG